jgi:hypothetical protein
MGHSIRHKEFCALEFLGCDYDGINLNDVVKRLLLNKYVKSYSTVKLYTGHENTATRHGQNAGTQSHKKANKLHPYQTQRLQKKLLPIFSQ